MSLRDHPMRPALLSPDYLRSQSLKPIANSPACSENSLVSSTNSDAASSIASSRCRWSCSFSASTQYLTSTRFRMIAILFGSLFIIQFMNISIGMTIICMVRTNLTERIAHPDQETNNNNKNGDKNRNRSEEYTRTTAIALPHLEGVEMNDGDYNWTPMAQGLVLSSLSWGRLLTPFAGLLADRYNVKPLFALAMSLAGASTGLLPLAAGLGGYQLVIFCRFLTGLGDAVIQPCVARLIPIWFPRNERNRALSVVTGGRQLAIVVVYPLAGYFCSRKDLLNGWPIVYYISAALASLWVPIWLWMGNQNPQKARWTSNLERQVISHGTSVFNTDKLPQTFEKSENTQDIPNNAPSVLGTKGTRGRVPWRALLSSGVFWANLGAVLCHEVPLMFVFLFLPTYMRDVLHFTVRDIGTLAAVPPLCFLIAKLMSAQIADVVMSRSKSGSSSSNGNACSTLFFRRSLRSELNNTIESNNSSVTLNRLEASSVNNIVTSTDGTANSQAQTVSLVSPCGRATLVARCFNTVASLGLGLCLIAVAMLNCCVQRMTVMALLVGAISFAGFHGSGCLAALLSFAPSYSGTVSGLTFFAIASCALVNPLVVNAMVPNGAREEWARIFQGAGAIALLPVVFFNLWGSAEAQPWGVLSKSGSGASTVATVEGELQKERMPHQHSVNT